MPLKNFLQRHDSLPCSKIIVFPALYPSARPQRYSGPVEGEQYLQICPEGRRYNKTEFQT